MKERNKKKDKTFFRITIQQCNIGRNFFSLQLQKLFVLFPFDGKRVKYFSNDKISIYCRAHSLEGPEPTYHQVVSGYEIYKHQNGPFRLKYNNKSLNEFQIAYETWGKLNAKKNNAILIFTGLSASSHAKSHEVWDRICFSFIKINQMLMYF